eukprot:131702_1
MLDDDDAILIELQPVVVNTSLVDDSPTERDPSLESEGNKVSEDRNKDRTSVHSTSFNFINSIIGAGIIGLPFALAECGFILGVILLFLVALICDYVARILVETGVKQNKHNFEVLADHLLGPKGYYAVVVSMFLFAFGAMVAYLVIIGDTVPMVFSHVFSESHPLASRRVCIVLFGILLIFPLCLLKSMANLAWSSSLSVLSVAVIVVAIVSQAPGEARDQGISAETQAHPYAFIRPSVFAGIGALSFAFVCQHSSFIVFNTLYEPTVERWALVTHISVGVSWVASCILAVGAYLSFFGESQGDILNNFDFKNVFINVARMLLAMTMVFTYPMENFVARHCVHAIIAKGRNPTSAEFYLVTLIIWGTSMIIALSFEDLGLILELTGSVSASMLGYILPILLHFRAEGFHRLKDEAISCWDSSITMSFFDRIRCSAKFVTPAMILSFGVMVFFFGSITSFL